MEFGPDVGLLYPGSNSKLLESLTSDQRPKQLIVLDGTWHHAKTLVRDIPQLQLLTRYRLAPAEPSQYCIRREPDVMYLSTLEATVAALRFLEPETQGFDELVAAFTGMIENQLSLSKTNYGTRRNHRRKEKSVNAPRALQDNIENIVVVYGETAPGSNVAGRTIDEKSRQKSTLNTPVYWVAERLISGERFECAIQPSSTLSQTFLNHLELPRQIFEEAATIDVFRECWESFLRPRDTIAFYYSNIPKLLQNIGGSTRPRLYLKSVKMDQRRHKTLDQLLESMCIQPSPMGFAGRAGKRLAWTIALAKCLRLVE